MDTALWVKALNIIPRMSKAEWDKLDVVARWLIITRAAVLIITFIPAVIAGILAWRGGMFYADLWLVMTIGLIASHATNNMINDLTDFRKGVDQDNYFRAQYGVQPLVAGLMTFRQHFAYIAATGLVAVVCGLYLAYARGGGVLALMAIGAFFVLFYTWPLKYVGLGELTVLLVWGPLMVGGGHYAVTGVWDWNVVIASLPYGLGATTVIFGKHVDKYLSDRAKNIRTLPVLIGEKAGRYSVLAMFALQYLFTFYLVVTGYFSPIMLVVVLALPVFRQILPMYLSPKPAERPEWFQADVWPLWFVAAAFLHNRRFGVLYILGLLIDAALHVFGVVA